MNKRNVLLVIVGVLLITFSMLGFSYALWVLNLTQTGENEIASSCFNVTFTDKNNINIEKAYPILDEEGKKLTPYEFTMTNNCDSYAAYHVNLDILKTSTLTNYDAVKAMISEKNVDTENLLMLDLLSHYEVTSKTLEEASTSYNLTTGYLDSKESKTYTLRLWLDENVLATTEGVQETLFSSKVVVTTSYSKTIPDYFCEANPDIATCKVKALAKEANENENDVYTTPDKTGDNCTYTFAYDGTDDNNLRYVGNSPCNYIKVDDEYWRIIGVMNNVDDGTGNKETRLKIMRSESIGNYSWDTSSSSVNGGMGVNEWSQADLMKLLNDGYSGLSADNSLYYNSGSGTCYNGSNNGTTSCDFTTIGLKSTLKGLIGNTLWHTGSNGANLWAPDTTGNVKAFYGYERSNDTVVRTTSWTRKIGLIYLSDYGYATSGGATSNRKSCFASSLYNWGESDVSDCKDNDWIFANNIYQFVMTPGAMSGNANFVYRINASGRTNMVSASTNYVVKPATYLVANAKITSGEGTLNNPYILGV